MEFDRIPRVYLTLRCNYNCSFCVLERKRRDMISGKRWLEILNAWPGDSVILAGGEPTLHPDFVEIVNGLNKNRIMVYTNLSFDVGLFSKVKKTCQFYASFHPGHRDTAETIADRAQQLKAMGHPVTVHINRASGNVEAHQRTFRAAGVDLGVEEDFFQQAFWTERQIVRGVVCTYPRAYFGPDGQRYICVKKMEDGDASGTVPDTQFPAVLPCEHGECNVCDINVREIRPIAGRQDLASIQAGVNDYGRNHWLKHEMWGSIWDPRRPWHKARLKAVVDNMEGAEVLDVACATGEITEEIRKRWNPSRIIGYEGCAEVAEKGRQLHPHVKFMSGLVENLPFAPKSFDAIHAGEIIEHVIDPAAFVAQLAQITRKTLVISTPSICVDDPSHIAIFSEAAFYEMLKAHFKTVKIIDAGRTFVGVCTDPTPPPEKVKAPEAKAKRPRLLFIAPFAWDLVSGYTTQTYYQLLAMSETYNVVFSCPTRPDGDKHWRPIDGVTMQPITVSPEGFERLAQRRWFNGFDVVVLRHPNYFPWIKPFVPPQKLFFYVSGSGINLLNAQSVTESRGVIMQGGEVNPHYLAKGLPRTHAVPINCTVAMNAFASSPAAGKVAPSVAKMLSEVRGDKPVFLLPTSLTKDKAIPDIIRAMTPLADRVKLLIVGNLLPNHVKLDPAFFVALEKQFSAPWITWVKDIPHSAMPFLFRACAAVIHFNRPQGGFDNSLQSTKILEAIASGRPVIARRTKGTQALLGRGYPHLVDTGTELTAAATKIVDDLPAAEKLGEKLRKQAGRFDVSEVAKSWRGLLGFNPREPNGRHVILLTHCTFTEAKGDSSQTLYLLRALSDLGVAVDVVYPQKASQSDLRVEMPNVNYHAEERPAERAFGLWSKNQRAIVYAMRPSLVLALDPRIPASSIVANFYGNHLAGDEVQKAWPRVRHVVTQSEGMLRHIESAGLDSSKVTVIPSMVDVGAFSPSKPPSTKPSGPVVVGYIGSLYPYQRVDAVVAAFNEIRKKHPCVLRVIGSAVWEGARDGLSATAVKRYNERLRKALTKSKGVEWVEYVPLGKVPQSLAGLDILVSFDDRPACGPLSTSLIKTKLLEAAAAGLCVVASRNEGNAALLGEDYPHLVDSKADLVASLTELIGKQGQRQELGAALRRRAKKFDIGPNGARLEGVLFNV